jgi:hypothetical protein
MIGRTADIDGAVFNPNFRLECKLATHPLGNFERKYSSGAATGLKRSYCSQKPLVKQYSLLGHPYDEF